jgi:hypothetical protein
LDENTGFRWTRRRVLSMRSGRPGLQAFDGSPCLQMIDDVLKTLFDGWGTSISYPPHEKRWMESIQGSGIRHVFAKVKQVANGYQASIGISTVTIFFGKPSWSNGWEYFSPSLCWWKTLWSIAPSSLSRTACLHHVCNLFPIALRIALRWCSFSFASRPVLSYYLHSAFHMLILFLPFFSCWSCFWSAITSRSLIQVVRFSSCTCGSFWNWLWNIDLCCLHFLLCVDFLFLHTFWFLDLFFYVAACASSSASCKLSFHFFSLIYICLYIPYFLLGFCQLTYYNIIILVYKSC